ncbi:MAG: hypothetical protein HY719_00110, partial [Planctomycetes bacterium]|nr:hypothetical protein [Planctomycetota bacterium]
MTPPVGDFLPGGAEVTFSEAGDFEIAARCKEDLDPLTFGFGPHVHIVDLLLLVLTEEADPSNLVVLFRGDPPADPLAVAPGSLIGLDVYTDEPGHEQDVWFEVTPGETADPSFGVFTSDGEAWVSVGSAPIYTIRVYHDKDGSFDYGGNDPYVIATVSTIPAASPIRVTADDGFDHADSSQPFPDSILVTTVVYTGEMIDLEAIFEDLAPRGGQVSTLARGARG